MNDTETDLNSETVTAADLTKADFPKPDINAINAATAAENPQSNPDLTGYNPEIHESPPRKNKRGEWAKRRGNKKGVIVGKPKTENGKPPLEIPKTETEIEIENQTENETAMKIAAETRAAAEMIANSVFFLAASFSDYKPSPALASTYPDAWERYLESKGGLTLPPWSEVALLSAQIVGGALRQEKAKPKLQKFKEWLAGKYYAFKNRRKGRAAAEVDKVEG